MSEDDDDKLKETRRRELENPTKAQKAFEERLRDAKILFEPQVIIGFYLADIVIPRKMIVIELDGGIHDDPRQRSHDKRRDRFILSQVGFVDVLRIRNENRESFPLEKIKAYDDVREGMLKDAINLASEIKKSER